MCYLCFFLLVLVVLVGISFFTLLERSVLGYSQGRSGPNSLGYLGILQPMGDAIKLFSSESMRPIVSNYGIYLFSPLMGIFLSLIFWMSYPFFFNLSIFLFGLLYFVCVSSVSVYAMLASGWSSNSVYGMLGSLRGVAQTISYEVSMLIILMSVMFMSGDFSFVGLVLSQDYAWFGIFMFPLMLILLSSFFAETNRSPFDFAEGESELVSGFNIEYSGGGFAFIFMAEYSSIMYMSMVFSLVFLGASMETFLFFFNLVLIMYLFVWIRASLPRYRYDSLMGLAWKIYLPVSLNIFVFFMMISFVLLIFILLSKANKSV
uniref:NADH-ubiquinone oxidoreductase chain 1 n=1 Tax=Hemiodoecus leai TaxID=1254501 RepID=A0A0U1XI18_9HEMI|nr:NADH dehydrogenase subunit 1 [Hemiodoecus leai]AIS38315.1 NADH dehydrogenase subunit 1 [Hemiodoecus leai]